MLYSIKSGTNHYETLGLSPEASFEEIERAYRREMSPLHPRAFGSLGSVTVAYETLRDPIKRRDYDASIGIVRAEPVRAQRRDFHFAGSAHFTGAGLPFPEPAPAAPAPVEPKPFMAAPPVPEAPKAAAPRPRPDPAQAPMIEDLLREYQARDGKKPAGEAEAPFEWKRPATVAGGFVLAVTLLGGLLGSWSGSAVDEPKAPARSTTKLLVPPARGLSAMDASAEAAEEPVAAAPVAAVQPVIERRRAPRIQARPVDRLAGVSEAIESPVVEAAAPSEPEASGPVDAAVIQASAPAPIPDTVIARTIHKIGYACGRVASTSPVEGSGSGVFKVTCTSGHSYQATPVHGRYRFRRSQ